jgi:prophage regulatory protein
MHPGTAPGILKELTVTRLNRLCDALSATGQTRSPFYADIQKGIMVRPVKIGPRAAAWPEHEIQAIVQARIAGATDAELRQLVQRLHAARKEAA